MFQSKKTILLIGFGVLNVVLRLASAVHAQDGGFQGQFSGLGEAEGAVLTLSQSGQQVVGQLQADGMMYAVRAQVSGGQGSGVVADPSSGATQPFRLALNGGGLVVTLPQTASGPSAVFRFVRGGFGGGYAPEAPSGGYPGGGYPGGGYPGGGYPGAGHPGAAYPGQGASPMYGGGAGGQLDPRLVGRWRKTESMVSGGASFVSDQHLVVRPDGTYSIWSGGSAGGTASVSVVGGGGGGNSGRWRVQGNIIGVSEGGPFQPYARYVVDGSDLMFVFGDGNKELWSRR